MCVCFDSPTLYVGKTDSHLYASSSLVHQGVSIVVSGKLFFITSSIEFHISCLNLLLLLWQPKGLTLARIEGPVTAGVTMGNGRPECEITPSTDVKYPPGSTSSLQNHWLLIGKVIFTFKDEQHTWFPTGTFLSLR